MQHDQAVERHTRGAALTAGSATQCRSASPLSPWYGPWEGEAVAYYRSVGECPRTRHTAFRDDQGRLRYEELMGEEGFSSDSSLLYHSGVPSAIVDSQVWELPDLATTPEPSAQAAAPEAARPAAPVVGRPTRSSGRAGWSSATATCGSPTSWLTAPSPLYRNAVGDECVYVEAGSGTVETVFGVLSYRPGDYVVIPRATTHRWLPAEESRLYAIEANSHIAPPKRYLSRYGQLLEHAPYCERDLHGPTEPHLVEGTDVEVLVKHRGNGPSGIVGTRLTYATHPFDVVGWDGCLYPYTFNVEDFMPITGKVHQPPPVHQVFEGYNFVVCNFLPRKVDYHPQSIPVPYYHSNVDSDEVMFYVGGDYEARKGSGIDIGSISLHPGGYAHGPQPARSRRRSAWSSSTSRPSWSTPSARSSSARAGCAVEDPAYAWTWAGRGPEDGGPAVFSNS